MNVKTTLFCRLIWPFSYFIVAMGGWRYSMETMIYNWLQIVYIYQVRLVKIIGINISKILSL